MATLHLICGLPGSGKSTLARNIEKERPALRLPTDEWMARIVGDGYDEKKRSAIEALQWELAKRVLSFGIDVILEFGFWSRQERIFFRTEAEKRGAIVKLHFLKVSREELLRRLHERNSNLPSDSFYVSDADLDRWIQQFEEPTQSELSS